MEVVHYINNTVWATLKPSKINGIGVFAIRDIPKGTRITDYSVHNIRDIKIFTLKEEEFEKIHTEIRELILDRAVFGSPMVFYSPNYEQTLQSFMNHSEDNNSDGEIAIRDIKQGEEITENYHNLGATHYMFNENR